MVCKKLQIPHIYSWVDKIYLKGLRPHQKGHWDNPNKDIWMPPLKTRIKSKLYDNQKGYCAYCNNLLPKKNTVMSSRAVEREHFVNKAKHQEYTFYRLNLLLACSLCNDKKHRYKIDFLVKRGSNYKKSQFLIIHPYLDNSQNHINFNGCIVSAIDDKGDHTIKCFELDEYDMVTQRANILSRQHLSGTITLTEAQLEMIVNYTKSR